MNEITRNAYAKINLALDVLRRREDGYHEVKMIMQTLDICDELTFRKVAQKGITIQVDDSMVPNNQENLIYKAAMLLLEKEYRECGVEITLKKVIPVAAGMAGGSSDAAATFLAINELFELGKSKEELMKLGVQIGADIPYCIMGGTALAEGIGEVLTALTPAPNPYVLVAKPEVAVATQFVYKNLQVDTLPYHPNIERMISSIEKQNLQELCEDMVNVLETVTIVEYPIIGTWKEKMKACGAITALMSGSGPTVFGVFETRETCKKAYEIFEKDTAVKQLFQTRFR